ncbi:hypothetical protein COCNU_scaffold003427G000020 [Cocos nucifera]|nr:hypothetical protein [Cocos nucifera]
MKISLASLRKAGKKKPVFRPDESSQEKSKKQRIDSPPQVRSTQPLLLTHPLPAQTALAPSIEILASDDIVIVETPASAVQALPLQFHVFDGEGRAPDGEGSNRAKANKGKAMEPPAFTIEYGPDTSSGEATMTIGMHIRATDQALQDRQLVEELMKMMTHDITILHEALNGFARLNSKLENKVQTANAWAEVAGELLHTVEEREKKYQEKLALLEIELGISQNKSTNLEEEFGRLKADFQKKMESALTEERGRGAELLKKLSAIEEKLLVIELAAETRV